MGLCGQNCSAHSGIKIFLFDNGGVYFQGVFQLLDFIDVFAVADNYEFLETAILEAFELPLKQGFAAK